MITDTVKSSDIGQVVVTSGEIITAFNTVMHMIGESRPVQVLELRPEPKAPLLGNRKQRRAMMAWNRNR